VSQEVIATHVVGTLSKVVAVKKIPVKTNALRADSAHRDEADAARLLRINRIEVIENRSVRGQILISGARGPPGNLAIESEIAPDNEIGGKAWIHTPRQRLRRVIEVVQVECRSRRCVHAADPELGIDLLLSMK